MQIYLLRHGIAEDGRPGQRDADRPLTGEGQKKLRVVLKRAKDAGLDPTLILASPYKRSAQSADEAAAVLGYKEKILYTQALQPDSNPAAVWDELRVHRGESQVLMVGHEPLFSALTGHLLGAPNLIVDFKKGALVRLDLDSLGAAPRGVLRWMMTARTAGAD